jgi:hypothetical protein
VLEPLPDLAYLLDVLLGFFDDFLKNRPEHKNHLRKKGLKLEKSKTKKDHYKNSSIEFG